MSIRRVTALTVTLLTLWLAQGAGAQTTTTTTSSTTSTSSTSTPSTTVAATTSTTQPNPCAGQPCTERPPEAYLAGVNGEVRIDTGGFCWRSPTPNAQGQIVGVCTSVVPVDPPVTLLVRRGETLTLRFDAPGAPIEVTFRENDVTTPRTAGNPVRFTADHAVGFHTIDVSTRWLQGDVSYRVRLDVRAAATPRTGTDIALTG
ncbi:MAG TPA: hypothetical protein VHF27_00765 [Acidimicrobiales bacterium]|nr:hypothetical protein [Acidimicrobiales bacterium]